MAPRTAHVKVIADDPQAILYANGVEIGRGSTVVTLPSNRSATFTGMKGNRRTDVVLDRELSPYGMVDLSACFLLFPLIGLCSPGAWQLTQDTVPLHIPIESPSSNPTH